MLLPSTPTEVRNILNKMKDNIAPGVDEIKSEPTKYSSSLLCPFLCHIVNRMLVIGIFPDEGEIARYAQYTKEGEKRTSRTIDQYLFYQYSQKSLSD